MKTGQQVTDIGSLMKEESLPLTVMDNCHAQNADGTAQVLDVEGSCKCCFEKTRPCGIVAEYEDVIDIYNDVDNQSWRDERVAALSHFS